MGSLLVKLRSNEPVRVDGFRELPVNEALNLALPPSRVDEADRHVVPASRTQLLLYASRHLLPRRTDAFQHQTIAHKVAVVTKPFRRGKAKWASIGAITSALIT